jgi:hypothetical protein
MALSVRKVGASFFAKGARNQGVWSVLRFDRTAACARRQQTVAKAHRSEKWSADVTARSNALDLEPGVFEKESAEAIAQSLKRSAETSDRRKSSAFRSAMSMLTFYINRGGRNLSPERKRTLEAAKEKLRALFGRKS